MFFLSIDQSGEAKGPKENQPRKRKKKVCNIVANSNTFINLQANLPALWVTLYVAVPCRNRRLFNHIFRLHRCLPFMRYSCIYEAHMSPTFNGSSVIQRFKHSNAIEICNGITFDFYCHIIYIVPHYQFVSKSTCTEGLLNFHV